MRTDGDDGVRNVATGTNGGPRANAVWTRAPGLVEGAQSWSARQKEELQNEEKVGFFSIPTSPRIWWELYLGRVASVVVRMSMSVEVYWCLNR